MKERKGKKAEKKKKLQRTVEAERGTPQGEEKEKEEDEKRGC